MWARYSPLVYAVVGVNAEGCRVAQLKSCRTSLAGGVSAGCLGSMSKLQVEALAFAQDNAVACLPPPVEILQITLFLRLLQGKLEVVMYFWNLLKVIRNLESLHI